MRLAKWFWVLGLVLLFVACYESGIPGLSPRETIIVTLKLDHPEKVKTIWLKTDEQSCVFTESVFGPEVKLACPLSGEGTYYLSVEIGDSIYSSMPTYAEGGYRPVVVMQADSFLVKEWL
mgnify:CR=1 FL=1